jgi:2-oxoglutarate ferredoxin oxidoreductase subunit gamma
MSGSDQMDILFTGVGGQGIQLVAKTLALAATDDGKEVMMSASFGAEIRGGHSDAAVCIATAGLDALPILPSASHAIVMQPMSWPATALRLRDGALAMINTNALGDDVSLDNGHVVGIAVDDLAAALGSPGAASFVMLGAFAGYTGVVSLALLQDAMHRLVPPYRSNLIAANDTALETGYATGHSLAPSLVTT